MPSITTRLPSQSVPFTIKKESSRGPQWDINPIWYRFLLDFGNSTITTVSGTGYLSWDGAGATGRTIQAASTKLTVTNGAGLAGNTTLEVNEAFLDISLMTGVLAIAHGGTGATTAIGARTSLGAAASGANTDITSVFLDNTGLKVKDLSASFGLVFKPNETLTSNRTLSITVGNTDRTLDITGNASVSGTNTGDQNIFSTVAVSGQSDIVADSTSDTLTVAAGTNITLTTDAATDTLTIATTAAAYTDENAQDAVGSILTDTATIDFTYDDVTPQITADVKNDSITYAKIQNVTTDRLLGRDTAGSGDTEEITVSGGLEFTGSTGIQRSALTGDVTASAGSNSTTIANDAVTTAKILDDAVTYAKIQNVSATDRILGRDTAGAGNIEELTVTNGLEFTGTGIQRSALTGDVTASAGSNSTTIANDAVTYAKMQNVSATDKVLGRSTAGAGDVEEIACTSAGRALIDDADASAQRTTLGLGTIATQNSNSVTITGGSVTGITDLVVADGGTGASSFTAYAVTCGGTTSTNPLQSVAALGSSGDVLTSNGAGALPTFQTPSAGSQDWELVGTASASASSSISFTNLSSTYFMYVVTMSQVIPATDSVSLLMRTSTDNGSSYDSGAGNYRWSSYGIIESTSGVSGSTSATSINLAGSAIVGNNTGEAVNAIVYIMNPSAASRCFIECLFFGKDNSGSARSQLTHGIRETAADVDAVQFFMSTGNITSGEFRLYGVRAA